MKESQQREKTRQHGGPLKWNCINDYLFVRLVAEVLQHQGFVSIDLQGDGPDGGIDCFATELVRFAIQGSREFRWAVQCKFSVDGSRRSVGDREISDVEGILRSERFQAQSPRGYMLVTNKRIGQNVIDRLRGIDRLSEYRTAWIDGDRLQGFVEGDDELFKRYFGSSAVFDSQYGRARAVAIPSVEESASHVPTVAVQFISASGKGVIVPGVIDTGSELSVVPRAVVERLEAVPMAMPESCVTVASPTGPQTETAVLYHLVARIGDMEAIHMSVLAASVPYAIVGWDVLRSLTLVIDGTGAVRLYQPEKST